MTHWRKKSEVIEPKPDWDHPEGEHETEFQMENKGRYFRKSNFICAAPIRAPQVPLKSYFDVFSIITNSFLD